MNLAFVSGFWLGFSLILAIGAQNAFVLRQGLKGEHVLLVVLICAVSDAFLIMAGVLGMGAFVMLHENLVDYLRWAGVAFLLFYGARSFWSAWTSGKSLEATNGKNTDAWSIAVTCFLLTWANPHVYLDTVVLLGSVAAQFGDESRLFGAGAVVSSFVFFFGLGYGARALRKPFANPTAWRILDALVGMVMWAIAFSLATMDF